MYSAVQDSAIVVGLAIQEFIRNSDERMQLIAKHSSNVTCPLHSEREQHEELGWKLLQEIRKVRCINLTSVLNYLVLHVLHTEKVKKKNRLFGHHDAIVK